MDLIAYAKQHNIPVTATAEKPYSTDANLMHISYEGGILEDPWAEPPENIFQLTRSPENARSEAQYIEISFAKGEPVAIDGKQLDPVALLETLNKFGGAHGIGRVARQVRTRRARRLRRASSARADQHGGRRRRCRETSDAT